MASLRAVFITVLFVTMTFVLMPLQWFGLRFHARLARRLPHFYHRVFCGLMGTRITVIGKKVEGGVLVTANHTGWLDIPILSAVMPASFVSKSEVASWPFFEPWRGCSEPCSRIGSAPMFSPTARASGQGCARATHW